MLGTCPVALASGDCPKKPAKTSLSLASFRVSSTGTHLRMEQSGLLRSNIQAGLRASVYPRQDLLQGRKEPRPPALGALVVLRLIRREARLLHAQVGPRARRGKSPRDDTLAAHV